MKSVEALAPDSFPGPLSFTKNGLDTGDPESQQPFRSQLIRICVGIYRKIRQIREIVEYRRSALFVLRLQPLKQQGGSPNDINRQTSSFHRPANPYFPLAELTILYETGEVSLFARTSARATRCSRILTYRTRSQIFVQKGDYSQSRFLAFCVVKRSQRPTSIFF